MKTVWIWAALFAGAQWNAVVPGTPAVGFQQHASTGGKGTVVERATAKAKLHHSASRLPVPAPSRTAAKLLSIPLDFEQNRGQAASEYAFVAHGPSYALGISATGMSLALHRQEKSASPAPNRISLGSVDSSVLQLQLVGANSASEVTGMDAQPGRSNYFIGNDPAKWRTNVPQFNRVQVAAVYPGINLVFHGTHQELEYDFDVAAGADPTRIRLQARGTSAVTIDGKGNAILRTAAGDVELKRPVAYQEIAGVQQPVESGFRRVGGDALEFKVGSYDQKHTLIIDPVLVYGVTFGGSNSNQGMGLTVDATGNTYVTGNTCSSDFPSTAGNFQSMGSNPAAKTCQDAFVVKLDPTASTLIFSDFIGGTGGPSTGAHVAVDGSQNVYVAGATGATNFPTVSNIGRSGIGSCAIAKAGYDCPDGFVLKLSPDGSELLFSSLLGGSQASGAFQIKLNPVTGDLDVLGETNSSDFLPTPTTLETTFSGGTCSNGNPCFNSFLLGLDPSTGKLRYGTFLGGAGNDWSSGLAFDKNGNIYVAGSTQPPLSASLGTVTHTYAPAGGTTTAGANLFIIKLNLSGTTLAPGYLTIVQGDADTGPMALAVDSSGYAYFAGATAAQHLGVTAGVFQPTNKTGATNDCLWGPVMTPFLPSACGTGLVGKIDATGALSFLTYLGGSTQDEIQAIGIDSGGNLWLTGITSSMDFPITANYFNSDTFAESSPFLAEMSNDGTQLPLATLIAGPAGQSSDVFVDASNNVYITGFASLPPSTPGVYPENPNAFTPVFVQKWMSGTEPTISISANSLGFQAEAIGDSSPPQTITIQNTGTTAAELGIQLSNDYSNSPISDFLESTNCGSSLAANSSCTITVIFAPGPAPASCTLPACDPTARTAAITISDNTSLGTQAIGLDGTAAIGPAMSVAPNPVVFQAQAAGTASAGLYVEVDSDGDSQLFFSNITLSGSNASDFQLAVSGSSIHDCLSAPVFPGSLCQVELTFNPAATATGTRTATLTFTDDAADSPQSVNITGTVAPADFLNISPLTLAPTFPVAIGTSTYSVLDLQNPTASTIQVTTLGISGTNASDFSLGSLSCTIAGALPMTIAPGATCYADVTFTPAADASGTRTATLTVGTTPTISGLPTVALKGDAVTNSQPGMSFFEFPDPMNFGGLQVGETSNNESVIFSITNNYPIPCAGGTSSCGAPLVINSITPGLSDYSVTSNAPGCTPFPVTISIGSTCQYDAVFTPAQGGIRNTTIAIQSNDPQGTVQLPVYGTGLTVPLGAFLETALNFGNSAIGVASPPMTTTLENTGGSALNISAVTASGDFNVSANTCTGSLAPQATCTISITFTPPTASFFSGMLTVTDNDALDQQQVVNLTGTGATGPQLRITPQTITFPNQTLNTLSAPVTVTLTSTGDSTVTFPSSAIATTQDFILESTTCAASLPQGSSCTANVQFKPTNEELVGFPEMGTMQVTDNATGSPQPIYMQGTGEQGMAATTTTLVSSLNPSTAGQSVTFTATVQGPAGDTTVPTGEVLFVDGTVNIGAGPLNGSGVATFSTSSLSTAAHSITAFYGGDTNFTGSTSPVLTQVVYLVAKAASTTSLISSLNPSASGQSVMFTATVTGPSGDAIIPTGSVSFVDGSTTIGSGTLNGSGQATFSTSSLGAGSHSITAVYAGDSNFSGSTSNVITQVVNAAAKASTTTALASSANPSTAGQSVIFTATVTGPSGNTTVPTGSVSFVDGTTTIGSGTLNGSGVATYSTSSLSTGTHSITAVYGGDSNFTGSTSSAVAQVVNSPAKISSTTIVASSLNPSGQGQSVTFTSTVTGPSGNSTVPTGTVTFMDGSTTLGSGSLSGSGQATYATSSLSTGAHSITAIYSGDTNFAGSMSTVLTQTVNATSFTISFSPTSVTINPGQTGTTTITVAPQNGFNQQVSFACSGLPAASTCSFSPSTVTPNGSAAMSTVTIATNVAMTPLHAPSPFGRDRSAEREGLLALVLFGLGGLVSARRRWKSLFCAVILFAGVGLVASGCGGSGGNGGGSGGGNSTTPAGTSTITVTATAGTLSQAGTFTLAVQ